MSELQLDALNMGPESLATIHEMLVDLRDEKSPEEDRARKYFFLQDVKEMYIINEDYEAAAVLVELEKHYKVVIKLKR